MEIYEIAVALWLDGNDSSIWIRTDWKSASFTGLGLQAHFFHRFFPLYRELVHLTDKVHFTIYIFCFIVQVLKHSALILNGLSVAWKTCAHHSRHKHLL